MNSEKLLHFKPSPAMQVETIGETSSPSLISVGRDEKLLSLREKILRAEGLAVYSLTPEEAKPFAHAHQQLLWIFCNTVELPELVYLACEVRRYSPESKLLLLAGTQPVQVEACLFHRILQPADGIGPFLESVRELSRV